MSEERDDRELLSALARLRSRTEPPAGWERAFASRVLARAQTEIERRARAPSFFALLARWQAPLVPAAAAALALAIVLASGGGAEVPAAADARNVAQAAFSSDPLDAVLSDPLLALIAAGEGTP